MRENARRMLRTQKATRRFNGQVFHFADWQPTKTKARIAKRKWLDGSAVNVRVMETKQGYNIYVRT